MDDLSYRPNFLPEEIKQESERIILVDRILANHGALTLKQIHAHVANIDKEGKLFEKLSDLDTFITIRTNVFDKSSGLFRNHSQEFREMFGYLVNFLSHCKSTECAMELAVQIIRRFDNMALSEVGTSEDNVRNFLKKHRNFFIMRSLKNNGDIIILNRQCFIIPSAWERDALPFYDNKIRYDQSIVLDGIGKVVSAVMCTRYVKIEITHGPFRKQTVYGLSKNVSNEENLALKYPIGTLVKVLAHRAYEAAHPWTATKVTYACDRNNVWDIGKTEKLDSSLTEYEKKDGKLSLGTEKVSAKTCQISLPECSRESVNKLRVENDHDNSHNHADETESNSVDRAFYIEIIKEEMKRHVEIEECLSDGTKTFNKIFETFIERDTFSYFSLMVEFISTRSHLYEISRDHVRMRSKLYRAEMLKLLQLINKKSKEHITVKDLRRLIIDNKEKFSNELYIYTSETCRFLEFLGEHSSLIEVAEAFGEQFVFLRGTYITDFNVFIPKFHFNISSPLIS